MQHFSATCHMNEQAYKRHSTKRGHIYVYPPKTKRWPSLNTSPQMFALASKAKEAINGTRSNQEDDKPAFLQSIVQLQSTVREYLSGATIFKQGDFGIESYKIISGLVGVYVHDARELGTSQTKLVAKLKPGETFGELALIRNTCERTATCIALQNNTTLRVHKRRDPVEIERVKKGLEVEEVTVESGEYIVREGEEGNSFFVITEGYVDVTVNDASFPEQQTTVNSMTVGEFFGEKAVLSPEKTRTASCIARSNVKMLRFTVQMTSIEDVLPESPIVDVIKRKLSTAECGDTVDMTTAVTSPTNILKAPKSLFDVTMNAAGKAFAGKFKAAAVAAKKDDKEGGKPASKWMLLKSKVVVRQQTSLSNFLEAQKERESLVQSVAVKHVPKQITLEPLGFSERRKSTSTKLFLDELAKFHKQGVEHARKGVDTQPPKALEWTVRRSKMRVRDELRRAPDVQLPRTLKNHMSREQIIYYRINNKSHLDRVNSIKSSVDSNRPTSFKPRKYKRPSTAMQRTMSRQPSSYIMRDEDRYADKYKYHYQDWLVRNNAFYKNMHPLDDKLRKSVFA